MASVSVCALHLLIALLLICYSSNFPPIMCYFREVQSLAIISGNYVVSFVRDRWFKLLICGIHRGYNHAQGMSIGLL